MDALTILPKGYGLTMTSREIAELLEKRHDNIKVSADRLVERGVIGTPAMQEFTHTGTSDHNGHAFSRAMFTPKGVKWMAGLWAVHKLREGVPQ